MQADLSTMPQRERLLLGAAFADLVRRMWEDPEYRRRYEAAQKAKGENHES